MRLSRLKLVNFRQHADTEIEFDTGLTGIIGPNGAGKSTIFEATAWALYGGDTARGGKDSIRFSRAGPRAQVRVELEFDLAGHRYRVVRGLTMAELYLDGAESPILTDVNLSIDEGEFVLVIGATGSGKTTLLRAVSGLVNCTTSPRPLTS